MIELAPLGFVADQSILALVVPATKTVMPAGLSVAETLDIVVVGFSVIFIAQDAVFVPTSVVFPLSLYVFNVNTKVPLDALGSFDRRLVYATVPDTLVLLIWFTVEMVVVLPPSFQVSV